MDPQAADMGVKIRLDVTGILRWGLQPPTGIQRVELALAHYARTQVGIEFVVFDFRRLKFVSLRSFESAYLHRILDANRQYENTTAPDTSPISWLELFRAQTEYYGPDTRRRVARLRTGKANSAFVKMCSTVVFVAAGLVTKGWDAAHWMFEEKGKCGGPDGSICLISYAVSMDRRLEGGDRYLGRRAYIIHDLDALGAASLSSAKYARRFGRMIRRVIGAAETIVCLSQAVRSDIDAWANVHQLTVPRIAICHFRNSLFYDRARATPLDALVGKDFVLFCSTFHARKRQHLLVALWRRLAETVDADKLPYLVLIGQAPKDYEALAAELDRAAPIASKIVVRHDIEDSSLRWAYKNAKFSIFPSASEGWGLGVSEALFFDLPVLHTSLPALSEASQGLMPTFAVDDDDAMFELVAQLIVQPELISELAGRCRGIVKVGQDAFAGCLFASLTPMDPSARITFDGTF